MKRFGFAEMLQMLGRSLFRLRSPSMLVVAAACLVVACPARGAEKEDADSLERLQSEIQRSLPAGWTATIDPAFRESPRIDDEKPALVVKSADKLPVEGQFPGAAPGQEPFKESRHVEIVLAVCPFLTPEQFAGVRRKNEDVTKARAKVEGRLRDIPWAYKGGSPIPPSAFRPRDDRDRRLVLEYALFWNRTELQPLPTHYAESLSFDMALPPEYSHITDRSKAREYDEIVNALKRLLTSYEKENRVR
jgi:hypothetical protein